MIEDQSSNYLLYSRLSYKIPSPLVWKLTPTLAGSDIVYAGGMAVP